MSQRPSKIRPFVDECLSCQTHSVIIVTSCYQFDNTWHLVLLFNWEFWISVFCKMQHWVWPVAWLTYLQSPLENIYTLVVVSIWDKYLVGISYCFWSVAMHFPVLSEYRKRSITYYVFPRFSIELFAVIGTKTKYLKKQYGLSWSIKHYS